MEWNVISCLLNSKEPMWNLITYRYWALFPLIFICLHFFAYFSCCFSVITCVKMIYNHRMWEHRAEESLIKEISFHWALTILLWIQVNHQTVECVVPKLAWEGVLIWFNILLHWNTWAGAERCKLDAFVLVPQQLTSSRRVLISLPCGRGLHRSCTKCNAVNLIVALLYLLLFINSTRSLATLWSFNFIWDEE